MRLFSAIRNRTVWAWQGVLCFYAKHFMNAPRILSVDETLDLIINERFSVSRNGDGELNIMLGESIPFQVYDARLATIMREAHTAVIDRYLSCIPGYFNSYENFNPKACTYFDHFLHKNRFAWTKLAKAPLYGNAFISRFYMDYVDKSGSLQQVSRLKQIWKDQVVVLVEGMESKLGVNNDLFDGARRLRRILGPAENAFSVYDQLMDCVKKEASKDGLILLALGPTATAMAYELAKDGYWAVDIGHIDIEYEWMLMGATSKVNVPGKYTNESIGDKIVGKLPQEALQKYESQIITRIQ